MGTGQFRLLASAASAQKIASGSASTRSAITASAAAAAAIGAGRPGAPTFRRAAASSAAFCGSSGDCRSAATAARRSGRKGSPGPASDPEGGVNSSRGPELLAGLREGDRVPQRRLVLAPVEQGLRHRGGAFERQAAAPDAGPRRVGSDDGIERGKRRAGEIKRLGLRMVAKRAAQARPGRGAGRFEGERARRESSQRMVPDGGAYGHHLSGESAPPVGRIRCPIRLHYQLVITYVVFVLLENGRSRNTSAKPIHAPNLASFRQSEDKRQFPGGLTLTAMDPPARLAPQGARCGLTRIPIDRPCLSPDLSAARERLAVGLCLADACDPRRA